MNTTCTKFAALAAVGAALTACAPVPTVGINNTAGRATTYEDVRSSGSVSSIGIESQDIVSMTDKMMRDMLAEPTLAGQAIPPRIIIDASNFINESASRVDKNLITDRLQIELSRAARGRMVFVGREFIEVVENERKLKEAGVVDGGTIRATQGTAGADYKLVGRISSLDAVDPKTGTTSRYQQISFRMLDLQYGTLVWGNQYEFRKAGANDVIYR